MSVDVKAQVEAGLKQIDQQVQAAIAAGGENKRALADLNDQIGTMAAQIQDLEQAEGGRLDINESQSMGMEFVGSDSFKAFANGASTKAMFDVQNAAVVADDASVAPDRQAGVVGPANRILRLEDLLGSFTTDSNSIEYTRENVFTNEAAEKADGATSFGESSITFTLETAKVATVGHTIPVPQSIIEDAPALASYIDGRMAYGALLRKEQQMLNGDGTGANIAGILKSGNHTVFTPGASSNPLENIRRAITKVEQSEYYANGIILNPADVEALDLDMGSDGHFRRDMTNNPWGLPIVKSNSITAGTFLLGDFGMGAGVWNRRGVTISMSESDGDNFKQNMVSLKADLRAALTVFRPASFVAGSLTA